MARVIQVLLFSMLVLSAYGQQPLPRADPRAQEIEERQRLTNLINLSKLLQTAARLAYPITTGLNNVVGNIMETDSFLVPNSHRHDSYERYPVIQSRRGNINRNRGRKRLRGDLQNQRRMSSRDATRRRAYKQTYYDYDYEYNDDYDSSEYYDSLEAGNEFVLHNSAAQSKLKPKGSTTKGAVLLSETFEGVPNDKFILEPNKIGKPPNLVTSDGVPLTKSNLHIQSTGINKALSNYDNTGNVLPATNDAKPKIIYVFLKPGDISPGPGTNNKNENDVSESDEDYNGSINPRFAPLENNPVPVNGTQE